MTRPLEAWKGWEALSAIYADPASEEHGFRLASLRWFLRFYQRLRPGVVAELQSRALPLFLKITSLRISGQQASKRELETYRETLWSWIDDFGLPKSDDMLGETVLTLLFPSPSGRPVFGWDSVREFLKTQEILKSRYSYPFTFQAPGWTPAVESIEDMANRLRNDFEKALSQRTRAWHKQQRIGADLYALWKRDKNHIRHIRWLAYTQACLLSRREIAGRRCSIDTVRRGLQSAADCLGLPRESIRQARPGRKPRPRSV